jgi:hypothetical protein
LMKLRAIWLRHSFFKHPRVAFLSSST